MLKILVMQPESPDGCTWYRITQFVNSAKKQGLAEVAFLKIGLSEPDLATLLSGADIYLCRLNETMYEMIEKYGLANMKKPIILDIDDNYEDVDPLSNSYEMLGQQDVQLKDGTFLWRTGESGFDRYKNIERIEKYKNFIKRADAVIVTTFELKNYAEQYNKNVVIIPNAINPTLFPNIDIRKDNRVNIVWSGGSSHYVDLREVQPVIKAVMEQYPKVHYYQVGQQFPSITKDLPQERTHTYDWIYADGHGYRMACLDGDIGIAPLKDITFNKYKSSVKYYEYSALNMATIAKKMPPYSDDIQHNHNGMLYSSMDEFRDCLIELINNPVKRITLAHEANKYVMNNRNVDEVTKDWVFFMNEIKRIWNQKS